MNVKHLTPELLRGMRAASIPTAEQQDHLEVRLLTMYIAYVFINSLIGPITHIYQLPSSELYKVASQSPSSWAVGAMFCVALVLALPHAIALLFFPRTLAARWPRKAATLAAAIVTVTWSYLAILSMPLDAGPLVWLYLRQAVESVGLAFLYAISLNAQLLRALHKVLHP